MTSFKWNCTPSHRMYFIAYPLLSKSIPELRADYEAKHQLPRTMHSRVPQAFPLNLCSPIPRAPYGPSICGVSTKPTK